MNTIKMNRRDFIEWYSDPDTIRDLGKDVLSELAKKGVSRITINRLFDNIGLIPFQLVLNLEEIKDELDPTELKEDEICPSLNKFKVKWETKAEERDRKIIEAL